MPTNPDVSAFPGFERPKTNFYRLPNSWFELWAWVRAQMEAQGLQTNQLGAVIKWMEFLLKHSWGYLNFDTPIRLTNDEFEQGRRRATCDGSRGSRMDFGTGLSRRTLAKVPDLLLELGLITFEKDESDLARIKHWYLPRINPERGDSLRTALTTAEIFEGFEYPETDWFSVPFDWTNLTRDMGSAVEILSTEYLMRHTFGWRDPIRWLTPAEIASGRQRSDGSTYDNGIQYSRNAVAVACKKLVEKGILIWRTARRGIGRETREYALRMQGVEVNDETGEWTASLSSDELSQSKPLVSQSTGIEDLQSTPQLSQSKSLLGQSKPLLGQSKPLVDRNTPRSDNNTSLQYSSQNLDTTPPPKTPPHASKSVCSVAGDSLDGALKHVGINGSKRSEILKLDDPPEVWEVYGWVYWAYAQEWADNPVGVAIKRLLEPETRHHVPAPFNLFGRKHGKLKLAAMVLQEGYRMEGCAPPPLEDVRDMANRWREHLGRYAPGRLPVSHLPPDLWDRERQMLRTGLDRTTSSEVNQLWEQTWSDFLAAQLSLPDELRLVISCPLGYWEDRLVILIPDLVARVAAEVYRSSLEDVMGVEIQFTAAEVQAPAPIEECEPDMPAADQMWEPIQQELQRSLMMGTYNWYFRHCKPLAFDNGCLTLEVLDTRAQSWIRARLHKPLTRAVQSVSCGISDIALVAPGVETPEVIHVSN